MEAAALLISVYLHMVCVLCVYCVCAVCVILAVCDEESYYGYNWMSAMRAVSESSDSPSQKMQFWGPIIHPGIHWSPLKVLVSVKISSLLHSLSSLSLLPRQWEEFKDIPRISKAMSVVRLCLTQPHVIYEIHKVCLKKWAHVLHMLWLLIDAYIVTIWPHSLPVNVLFVSTSLLIVSFSLEILWSRSWFCRNQHLQWNQCIPGWLWDRASGEGLSLTHSLSLKCNLNFLSCN